MPYVTVDPGVSVFYEDWGEGDRYIFTSQIYLDYYAGYARELSKRGYHVIAVQMRGYGRSSRVPQTDNASDCWVPDLLKVADHLGVKQFAYTGISHGSSLGFKLMEDYPDRILGYAGVVCGPKLKGNHPSSISWRERDVARAATEEGWRERCEENRRNTLAQIRPYHSEYWKDQIRKYADADYENSMHLDKSERVMTFGRGSEDRLDTEEKLIAWMKTVTTPVIIFGGMKDPIVVPEAMFRTAQNIPHCKMVMYGDCDHGVSIAHGEDLVNEIDNFFRERKVFEK
ncbi:MAG: alpha/beta hydrolase [Firmicutes bacterium]|nr:alpha/beta hydrolase [Bacillota bacterium]